jgi:hypothetical protein
VIKVGDTAFLKTTGEVVFVLEIHPCQRAAGYGNSFPLGEEFSAQEVFVRIPILSTGGGIEHETKTFLIEELETAQEKFDRELEQFTQLQKRQPLRPLEDDPKKVIN